MARPGRSSLDVRGHGSVAVGLPLLDVFLNENGTALAATGQPLPARFGTWFLGLAEQARPNLMGQDQRRWLDRLELDRKSVV